MANNNGNLKVFSGNVHLAFAKKVATEAGVELGERQISYFSDGEIWVKYDDNIRGCDVFIIQPTHSFPPRNLMELLIMIRTAVSSSAKRITAVIPYFGYSRQDKRDQARTTITAKLVANLIEIAGADRMLTMDFHNPAIEGFFNIPVDHLYSATNLLPFCEKFNNSGFDLVVVSPDFGGSPRCRFYAKHYQARSAIIEKRRPRKNEAEVVNVIGDVKGLKSLVIDDIIDTVGTVRKGGKALRDKGTTGISLVCTHPLFTGAYLKNIVELNPKEIVVTDTLPISEDKNQQISEITKLNIVSVADLFGKAIKFINADEPLSDELFIDYNGD